MKVIGLTGGIASGKSTVSKEMRSLQIPVFDADEVSHQAVAKGSKGLRLVCEALGEGYLTAEGTLDRAKVSNRVFQDKAALRALEAIIHKIVWKEAEKFLAACRAKNVPLVVLDVPLLIECGWYKLVDQVWLVAISREQQIERAMQRDGMTADEVKARIGSQMPLEEKKQYADQIIDNSGTLEMTLADVHVKLDRILGE